MICSKPVLVSNLPAIKKIIEESKCGLLVDPLNIDDISKAIVYMIEHPMEIKAMGHSGKRYVQEKYNWSKMEDRLIKLYQEISR